MSTWVLYCLRCCICGDEQSTVRKADTRFGHRCESTRPGIWRSLGWWEV